MASSYLSMVEFNQAFTTLIVLAVDGRLVDRPPVHGYGPVSPVLPQDGDLGVAAALLHQVPAFLKLKRSGL